MDAYLRSLGETASHCMAVFTTSKGYVDTHSAVPAAAPAINTCNLDGGNAVLLLLVTPLLVEVAVVVAEVVVVVMVLVVMVFVRACVDVRSVMVSVSGVEYFVFSPADSAVVFVFVVLAVPVAAVAIPPPLPPPPPSPSPPPALCLISPSLLLPRLDATETAVPLVQMSSVTLFVVPPLMSVALFVIPPLSQRKVIS